MSPAYLIAVASVAAGTALGLVRGGGRLASTLRTFAFVSALAVVLGQLLPEALGHVGLPALVVFAVGLFLPHFLLHSKHHAHGEAHGHAHPSTGLMIGLLVLALHKVGDGIALGAFGGHDSGESGHAGVLVAIAAHTVPVVAMMVQAIVQAKNVRAGALAGGLLGLSTTAGVLLSSSAALARNEAAMGWLTALVAGMLMHVVTHDWAARIPKERGARALDALATVAGLGIVLAAGSPHGHGDAPHAGEIDASARILASFVELSLETAPALLIGLLVAAALQTHTGTIGGQWLTRGGSLSQAIRGAITGAPLPVCACGVLPLAHALKGRGARAALVVSFLLATPEIGIESFALSVRFLGWEFALTRLFGALLVAVVAGVVVARFTRPEQNAGLDYEPGDDRPWWQRAVSQLDELTTHVLPWTLIGLLMAAYVDAVLSHGALEGLAAGPFELVVVTALAIPTYVCATSATPLAAVLLAKGLSPGAALVALLLGPATNIATLGWMRASYGAKAAAAMVAGAILVTWAMATGINSTGMLSQLGTLAAAEHEHGVVAIGALGALLVMIARGVYLLGVRGWLGGLGSITGAPRETDDDGHGHGGHGHGHGHAH